MYGLDLEFTFAVRGRTIEPELLSESLGIRDFSDAARLVYVLVEPHFATLGVLKVSEVSNDGVMGCR